MHNLQNLFLSCRQVPLFAGAGPPIFQELQSSTRHCTGCTTTGLVNRWHYHCMMVNVVRFDFSRTPTCLFVCPSVRPSVSLHPLSLPVGHCRHRHDRMCRSCTSTSRSGSRPSRHGPHYVRSPRRRSLPSTRSEPGHAGSLPVRTGGFQTSCTAISGKTQNLGLLIRPQNRPIEKAKGDFSTLQSQY